MTVSARNWAWSTHVVKPSNGKRNPGAEYVLLCLAEFESAAEGYAWPTLADISDRTGFSERAIREHIAALEEAGAVRVVHERYRGQWANGRYYLRVSEEFRASDKEWQRGASSRLPEPPAAESADGPPAESADGQPPAESADGLTRVTGNPHPPSADSAPTTGRFSTHHRQNPPTNSHLPVTSTKEHVQREALNVRDDDENDVSEVASRPSVGHAPAAQAEDGEGLSVSEIDSRPSDGAPAARANEDGDENDGHEVDSRPSVAEPRTTVEVASPPRDPDAPRATAEQVAELERQHRDRFGHGSWPPVRRHWEQMTEAEAEVAIARESEREIA